MYESIWPWGRTKLLRGAHADRGPRLESPALPGNYNNIFAIFETSYKGFDLNGDIFLFFIGKKN